MKLTDEPEEEILEVTKKQASRKPRYFVYPFSTPLNSEISFQLDNGNFGPFNSQLHHIMFEGRELPVIEIPELLGITLNKGEFGKECKFLISFDNGETYNKWKPGESNGT